MLQIEYYLWWFIERLVEVHNEVAAVAVKQIVNKRCVHLAAVSAQVVVEAMLKVLVFLWWAHLRHRLLRLRLEDGRRLRSSRRQLRRRHTVRREGSGSLQFAFLDGLDVGFLHPLRQLLTLLEFFLVDVL